MGLTIQTAMIADSPTQLNPGQVEEESAAETLAAVTPK